MRQRSAMLTAVLALAALGLAVGLAQGGTVNVTFDESQLVNNDQILQFYNGGTTFLGNGPGPNLGVSFTANALVLTQTGGLVGTFTKPGVMLLFNSNAVAGESISATMDAQGGIAGALYFDYAEIDTTGMLQIYSGLDGGGTLLTTFNLPVTSTGTPGVFVANQVTFSGVAQSVVFTGGNQQLAFDDLTWSPTPEPSTLGLLAIGAVALCWKRART